MLDVHLRHAATVLLESAIRIAPPDTREWGQAMQGELSHVEGAWAAVMWALGSTTVLVKDTLASLLIPGRRGRGLAPDEGLFAKSVSFHRAALLACGVCVLGALLFFAAPPFRQAVQVSFGAWRELVRVPGPDGQPGLIALSQRAEARHDPEALVFVATRLWDGRERARLAEEAVRLDPNLTWAYAVVAVHRPDLPQNDGWVPKLEQWDPQNGLFPLITAESIDIALTNQASRLSPKEKQKNLEEDPAWQKAMEAAFSSPRFDDYLNRLEELDRRVVRRYRFNDPDELLSGEEASLPTYAFSDAQRFAKSVLQSGQSLEAGGDSKGATEKYWAVARFGQLLDAGVHSPRDHTLGTTLQAAAYKRLQVLSEKGGHTSEAALFGYLASKFDPAQGEHSQFLEEWVFGQEISKRNAAVLQISSLMMFIFSGLILVAISVLIVGRRRTPQASLPRPKPLATAAALAGAVGFLVSSAAIYLTYRPYWYIFQREILNGDRSRTRDLRNFLLATHGLPGVESHAILSWNFPVYFWTGVTLLSVICLVLILLRHILVRPRTSASA